MHQPLLDRIRELETANRRWKSLCAILSVMLLAVLTTGSAFMGYHGYRALVENRHAVQAMEEARMQEMAARDQAEAARLAAEQALQQVQQQRNQK